MRHQLRGIPAALLCLLAMVPARGMAQSRPAQATMQVAVQVLPARAAVGGDAVAPVGFTSAATHFRVSAGTGYRMQVRRDAGSAPLVLRRGVGPALIEWPTRQEIALAQSPGAAGGPPGTLEVVLEPLD